MDLPIWERKVVEGILRDVREELLWSSLLDRVLVSAETIG